MLGKLRTKYFWIGLDDFVRNHAVRSSTVKNEIFFDLFRLQTRPDSLLPTFRARVYENLFPFSDTRKNKQVHSGDYRPLNEIGDRKSVV